MRDFDKKPYSPDEAQVAKWLVDRGGFGGGDDPIGFLLTSYEYVVEIAKGRFKTINEALQARTAVANHDDGDL